MVEPSNKTYRVKSIGSTAQVAKKADSKASVEEYTGYKDQIVGGQQENHEVELCFPLFLSYSQIITLS